LHQNQAGGYIVFLKRHWRGATPALQFCNQPDQFFIRV